MAVRDAGRRTDTATYGKRGMRVKTCMPLLHVLADAKKMLRQRKRDMDGRQDLTGCWLPLAHMNDFTSLQTSGIKE